VRSDTHGLRFVPTLLPGIGYMGPTLIRGPRPTSLRRPSARARHPSARHAHDVEAVLLGLLHCAASISVTCGERRRWGGYHPIDQLHGAVAVRGYIRHLLAFIATHRIGKRGDADPWAWLSTHSQGSGASIVLRHSSIRPRSVHLTWEYTNMSNEVARNRRLA
jgi:hypothetical protein